MKSIWVRNWLV